MANQGLVLHKHAIKRGPGAPPPGGWELKGVTIDNDELPERIVLSTGKVTEGQAEGWITVAGADPVIRPAGPTMDDWNSSFTGQPHVFMHLDSVTIHTLDQGDVTYNVVRQPDKYADHGEATWDIDEFDADDDTPVTAEIYEAGATRVDHFYVLELEG